MLVFHFLANFLKDEPLFDNEVEESFSTGAVYNDFDSCPMDTLLTQEEAETFCYSQPNINDSNPINENESVSMEEALDNAVMEADKNEGILYEHLQFDTVYFDNSSEECTPEYCAKVHALATNFENAWTDLKLTGQAIRMFERRMRTDWSAPDTVFDAWLLRRGCERSWFDSHQFYLQFPDFECTNMTPTASSTPISQHSEDSENDSPPKKRQRQVRNQISSSSDSKSDSDNWSSSSSCSSGIRKKATKKIKAEPSSPKRFRLNVEVSDVLQISDSDEELPPVLIKVEPTSPVALFKPSVIVNEVVVITDTDGEDA